MSAVQTTYQSDLAPGRPGMIPNATPNRIVSKLLQSTSLAFGQVCFRGTVDNGVMGIGTTGAGAFLGIAVEDNSVRPSVNGVPAPVDAYSQTDTVAVLERGAIFVTTASAVTPAQPVYYDTSGNLTSTASGNTAIPNAIFTRTAAAGGLTVILIG